MEHGCGMTQGGERHQGAGFLSVNMGTRRKAVSARVGRAMRSIHGPMLQWGGIPPQQIIRAVPAHTEEVHHMPTTIVKPDTFADRARRAAAKRKKDKAEERRRRQAGSEIWALGTVPTPKTKSKGTGKPA